MAAQYQPPRNNAFTVTTAPFTPLVALAQYDCNRFSLFLSFSISLTEYFSPFLVIVPSRCLDKKRPHQLWDPPRSLRSLPEILSFHPIFFFLSIYKHTQTLYWMDVYVHGTCIYISLSLKSSSGQNKNSRKYLEVRGALDEGVQLLGRFRRAYFFAFLRSCILPPPMPPPSFRKITCWETRNKKNLPTYRIIDILNGFPDNRGLRTYAPTHISAFSISLFENIPPSLLLLGSSTLRPRTHAHWSNGKEKQQICSSRTFLNRIDLLKRKEWVKNKNPVKKNWS